MKIKKNIEVKNFKELIEYSSEKYQNNIAYKYRKSKNKKDKIYEEKTYNDVKEDVNAISNYLLNNKIKGKKVILIGNNRYEWCISYFGVTCSNNIIAPMDCALPENEIKSLVARSEAELIICENKFIELAKQMKNDKNYNLKTIICMDDTKESEVINLSNIIKIGKELIKQENKLYEKVNIDENKMAVLLFTSGTTSKSKIVMLSQKNICSNICAYSSHFKILHKDTLLSFLPMHHTFESSITFLYGFYSGATVAFSDGLRYIQSNLEEYKISIFVTVPLILETMYKKIIKQAKEENKEKQLNNLIKISNILLKLHIDLRKILFKKILKRFGGKLRIVLYGAASLDKETIKGLDGFGINSIQGYGLTETSPVIAAESEKKHKPGSVGYPLDNIEVKLINVNEENVGEICVKGPNIMLRIL